ncbi:MAG: flagellar FlbD family protein [Treponema sp.]|jgi:flagellar protein FlbD|nr:flagellar FlbD family protein [Treponema sp.]
MIKVTRLNGTEFYVNANQIECVEVNPDTTLVMQSGSYHIIKESVDEVLDRVREYQGRIVPPVVQE